MSRGEYPSSRTDRSHVRLDEKFADEPTGPSAAREITSI
jgi:hypothetical protein